LNDSSILITIISCDYLNLSLADEHVGDVTIPTQVIEYTKIFSRRISQLDSSIQIKLNYYIINVKHKLKYCFPFATDPTKIVANKIFIVTSHIIFFYLFTSRRKKFVFFTDFWKMMLSWTLYDKKWMALRVPWTICEVLKCPMNVNLYISKATF
jgi:hypothetical protein